MVVKSITFEDGDGRRVVTASRASAFEWLVSSCLYPDSGVAKPVPPVRCRNFADVAVEVFRQMYPDREPPRCADGDRFSRVHRLVESAHYL